MKKIVVFFLYALWPVLPAYFYIRLSGTGIGQYTLSMVLGIFSYVWLGNQFMLAARPNLLVRVLGLKTLIGIHSVMPPFILVLAGLHRILKVSYGFNPESTQARFGGFAWWLYAALIVFTLLFMANTNLMKFSGLKKLRAAVYKKTGLTYQRSRLLHNLTVLGILALAVHIAMASSSQLSHNPWGFGLLQLWMLLSVGLYIRYRLRGRKS